SSGVNISSGSFPKSHSSQYSDLSVTHTPLSVDQSPDSGIVTTPLPSSRFRFVSWQRLEESDVRGDQLSCPRVREGPSEEDLFLRKDDIPLERGRRKRREEEGQRCRSLNLHRNHLTCVRQLPKLPAVEHLCLSENSISTLGGLGALGTSPLYSLTLTRNPVNYIQDYRARVFSCLPKLRVLDGIPKLPEDSMPPGLQLPAATRMCNIL
ncbi:unnamed protein product, partial [Coregonus sp. 'balchen']